MIRQLVLQSVHCRMRCHCLLNPVVAFPTDLHEGHCTHFLYFPYKLSACACSAGVGNVKLNQIAAPSFPVSGLPSKSFRGLKSSSIQCAVIVKNPSFNNVPASNVSATGKSLMRSAVFAVIFAQADPSNVVTRCQSGSLYAGVEYPTENLVVQECR